MANMIWPPVAGSGGGSGGAVSVANGDDVALGATTDAAVSTDTTGTVSGKLRGLVKILADVWDSASHYLKVQVQGAVPVTDNGGVLSVDDAGGSLTVDGTVAISGSVAVTGASGFPPKPTNVLNQVHSTPGAATVFADTGALGATGLMWIRVLIGMQAANDFFIAHRNAANAADLASMPTELTSAGGQFQVDIVYNITNSAERIVVRTNGAGAGNLAAAMMWAFL